LGDGSESGGRRAYQLAWATGTRMPAYVGIRLGDDAEARDEPDHDVLG
jgi:hypothetical protein